ncbi:ferrous iron transport protein B [Chloroherpeton thalassium ATCC 35110]|uniref:Ferrous iron transport protein B n=1 Tax=Chloroherpeton thalassium (strain ATCC 35110 / GB-78) TaxID=517418 RepID=B3QT01_CHLT3|nr:ferrous iron transport protein B [Chloroherpeton thalassium]ACF12644.1 ferrous iron transport protein B [Chloroherpeton thalassium ATCC 35110]
MNLAELHAGQNGFITKVKGRGAFRKRISEMGFVRGKQITRIKDAPLKDPIEFKLMGFNVSLRKSEAEQIEVVTESEAVSLNGNAHSNGTPVEHFFEKKIKEASKQINVVLVGNPNSGKTSLFNYASGSNERTGNYSGVTISPHESLVSLNGYRINIVDLPGTYSLSAYTPEETFVRRYIIDKQPDVVINIVDASNLERNLYLTTQLIDMDIKVVMALNMYDELTTKGDTLHIEQLGELLGIPIVPTIASKGKGIKQLFDHVIQIHEETEPTYRHIHIQYGDDIEKSLHSLQELIWKNKHITDKASSRLLAVQLLEKDKSIDSFLSQFSEYETIKTKADHEIASLEKQFHEESSSLISEARYGFIAGALKETYQKKEDIQLSRSDKIDNLLTHRIYGYPIFLFFLWIVFQATFSLGQYPVEWLEFLVGEISSFFSSILPAGFFKDLVVSGIIDGTGSVLVFLPNIVILFLFISIMEDTGYMARVAFIMDKLMHRLGLHGKSFIPLIIGFGCNVPAIMATRTIENPKDRLLTMLIVPFMSCSARLPVYILLISAFFPEHPVTILFSLYLIGILLSMLFSFVFNKIIFKTGQTPFVMELPPYRVPTLQSVIKHVWFRAYLYLKKVGGVILIASVVVWMLQYFPRQPELDQQLEQDAARVSQTYETKIQAASTDEIKTQLKTALSEKIADMEFATEMTRTERSYLGQFGKTLEPVFRPLGFDWKISVSLLSGIAAKEIVLSTMGVLFQTANVEEDAHKLEEGLSLHFASLNSAPPFLTALSLLLFILIYFPCLGVVVAVGKESGSWKWAVFVVSYTSLLAWVISFGVFQIGSLIY